MSRSTNRVPMFASLAVRNYRLYFVSGLLSNVGTWMSRTAQAWLVLTILTHNSATALGIVTALQFGPVLFFSPLGGVLADKLDKRTIIIVTQAALGIQQLLLFALISTGTIRLWHVYLLAATMAIIGAFDMPSRMAFASEMVGPTLLSNAVGLNSASFNIARLIGPGLAGLVIALWGVAPAFLINGISFIAVIIGQLMMKQSELRLVTRTTGKGSFREGVSYLNTQPQLKLIIAVIFLFGVIGLNFNTTNALMISKVYAKGAIEFGVLGSVMAIGSIAASLMAARRARARAATFFISLSAFVVFNLISAWMPNYFWFCVATAPLGFVTILAVNTANARVQLGCDPNYRGRVMSIYSALFMGSTFIGAPLIGWISDSWGGRWAITVGSIGTAIIVIVAGCYALATKLYTTEQIASIAPWHKAELVVAPEEISEQKVA